MCRVQTTIIECKRLDNYMLKTLTGIALNIKEGKTIIIDDTKYEVIMIEDVISGDTVTREVYVVDYRNRGTYTL